MAQVKNLAIKLQTGSDSTYLATWEFDPTHKITTTTPGSAGGVRVGDYVRIKQGATWYNGVAIAPFVFNDSWKVIELSGVRAVLGPNSSGSNNIVSPIHVSNLIGGSGGGSAGSTTTTTVTALDHYEVKWTYDTGDNIWFEGNESKDVKVTHSTYSGPSNAKKVKVTVKPVSKTRKVNGKDTPYWSGTAVSHEYSMEVNPPEVPPAPNVVVDKYDLKAEINNVSDPRTDEIQFEVYDGTTLFNTGTVAVKACLASFQCKLNAGGSYRVRARAINLTGGKSHSAWTAFTNKTDTIPTPPADITTIRGSSATSIYLEWAAVNSAKTYDIEYATKITYFDNTSQTTTVNSIQFNHYELIGLQSGQEYFFRVRAVNEKGESAWSGIKSVVIGKKPVAPTTWSSSTTVITGEELVLYWVHNAEDGSTETFAEVELDINGVIETHTARNDVTNEETKDKTKFFKVNTVSYLEGTKIQWRVRTAGVTKVYGDWSIKRTVDIYAPPTLELNLTDQNGGIISVLKEFPFFIKGLAGPKTQMPIGYHVSVTADTGYETLDVVGRPKIVNPGDEVYSRYIDTNDPLLIEMHPHNIDLENNITYTVTVTASMNSGLLANASKQLGVSWADEKHALDTEIAIDEDSYVAYITPYCRDANGAGIPDVMLSVYRREFDGTFTELAVGLDATKNIVVTDPHPALDYARYRIVAITKTTGAVSYYDPPGYPVNCKAVIVQWDEKWTDFDVTNSDVRVQPSWAGSLLKLLYNIDVNENTSTEASLIKYIGREYPVSYYGTQIETSPSWNMEIPAYDKETIYALRRLAIFKGDVYVREPSGVGYWASIKVSFSQKHCELTIPVTLDITRVAGGV